MVQVVIYGTSQCPFCRRAEMLLAQRGFKEVLKISVDSDPEQLAVMVDRSGRRTVPQIFIGDSHVGGFDDLAALDSAGGLLPPAI